MADAVFREAQVAALRDDHVGPINSLVDDLIREREEWMPYVAPTYGGVHAEILLVLRDPGPKTREGSGSGMLSAENDDPGAERAASLLDEAGLSQRQVVSWNAYPWYINRKPTSTERDAGVEALARLLELLPKLKVVMLLGGDAKAVWSKLKRAHPTLAGRFEVIETYHTGNQAFIGTKEVRDARMAHLGAAFAKAAAKVREQSMQLEPASSSRPDDLERKSRPELEQVPQAPPYGASAPRRAAEAFVNAATGNAERRWTAAQRRAEAHADLAPDERVTAAIRSFATELGAVGATVGASAAAPGVGTGVGLAASFAEVGVTARRLADLILTIAAIRGMSSEDLEERKAWVLSVLAFGNSASAGFSRLAGEMGKGLGKKATAKVPSEVLRQINRTLGRTIITKYGTKRGAMAIGKLLPLGIGAAIGGSANYVLVRQVGRQADHFFKAINDKAL